MAVALECFRYLVFVWRRKREGSYYLTCGKEKKIKRTKKKKKGVLYEKGAFYKLLGEVGLKSRVLFFVLYEGNIRFGS